MEREYNEKINKLPEPIQDYIKNRINKPGHSYDKQSSYPDPEVALRAWRIQLVFDCEMLFENNRNEDEVLNYLKKFGDEDKDEKEV